MLHSSISMLKASPNIHIYLHKSRAVVSKDLLQVVINVASYSPCGVLCDYISQWCIWKIVFWEGYTITEFDFLAILHSGDSVIADAKFNISGGKKDLSTCILPFLQYTTPEKWYDDISKHMSKSFSPYWSLTKMCAHGV